MTIKDLAIHISFSILKMPFKAASVLLVVAVALVSFSAVSKADCEDPNLNKSTSKIKRYFIYNDKLVTFLEAWHQCRSHGLQLATVKSAEDDAKLKLAFAANNFNQKATYWIAGTDLGKNGSYVWITDDTPISYTNYLPGQPDNYGEVEHCLLVGWGGLRSTQWNDGNCEVPLRYVCELETCDC